MDSENFKHLVSDETTLRFLHRTSLNLVEKILKEGLFNNGDLSSTATLLPPQIDRAKELYQTGYPERIAAIIIGLPRGSFRKSDVAGTTKGIAYFHPIKRTFAIQPKFIEGWFDRRTHKYCQSPYRNIDLPKGFESFEYLLD